MGRVGFLLAILLALSLVLNARLLLHGSDEESADGEPSAPPDTQVVNAGRPPVKSARGCEQHLRRCSKALLEMAAKADDARADPSPHELPSKQFPHELPNDSLTERFVPWLEEVFADSTFDHDLDCRGNVCKLTQVVRQPDQTAVKEYNAISRRLQTRGAGKGVCSWEFRSSQPSKDLTSGEEILIDEAYFRPCNDSVPSGRDIIQEVLQRFEQSSVVEDCRADFPERGSLEIRVDGLPDQQLIFFFGGKLAYTPAGNCIEQGLRGVASGAQVPAEADSGVIYYRVEL